MKFGYLLASFNIVLFLCFLTVFLLPAFILDFTFMEEFWTKSWYIGILFLMLILFVNLLYARNRILLQKLEQERFLSLVRNRAFHPAENICAKSKSPNRFLAPVA